MKLCTKLGKETSETCYVLTEAYGEDIMSKTRVYDWHKNLRASWKALKMQNILVVLQQKDIALIGDLI